MERGMFFEFESNQRVGKSQFYQNCILIVDIGKKLAGTPVGTIQVLGNSMTLDLDGERIRFKIEFVEQNESVSKREK